VTARLVPTRLLAAAAVVLAAAAVWAAHHVFAVIGAVNGDGHRFTYVYAAMFGLLVWQLGVAYLERPAKVGVHDRLKLDQLNVVAIVPAFHEDPAALKACLESMIRQTRRPNIIYVVDDGSTAVDYTDVKQWFHNTAPWYGITAAWYRQENAGKRHAQGAVVRSTPDADVYWTVDSDTVSDPHALEELLKPLANPKVQSVAGIVMAANVRRSFLTRFTDLWFVAGQLTDRSSLSVFGSVWVNSGPIAVYRAAVVRDNLDAYLAETFFGRRVPFSDDSMLTLFAMLRGRTVQQPTAYAFSLMPEKTGHFTRMFLRWMRGSFIRSWWRLRYLPLASFAYWAHLLRWAQTVVAAVVFVAVAVWAPITDPNPAVVPWLIVVPLIVGYAQTLRYLTVRRSDQSLGYQWATWALTPVAVVWALLVLRAIRWYGVATCWRTGWGTRKTVEVSMAGARPTGAG
jgi:hyaluronan synthase